MGMFPSNTTETQMMLNEIRDLVRMLKSAHYKAQLKEFANTFKDQKKELHFLMMQKTTVTVVQMSEKLSGVADSVDKIANFLEVKSDKEKQVEALVAQDGGVDVAIKVGSLLDYFRWLIFGFVQDDKLLKKVAQLVGDEMDSSVKYALRTDLQAQLSANQFVFSAFLFS